MKHFFYFFALLLLSLSLQAQNVVCNFSDLIEFSHNSNEVFLSSSIVFCNSGDNRSWTDQASEQEALIYDNHFFCRENQCSADQGSEQEEAYAMRISALRIKDSSKKRSSTPLKINNAAGGFVLCDSADSVIYVESFNTGPTIIVVAEVMTLRNEICKACELGINKL